MTNRVRDVVILGAGPAGSTTAALLAERGVDVLLLDRARFPRPKPCAEYLSPEATRVLDRLGLLPRIDAFGPARLTGMRIVGPSGADFTGHFAGHHEFRGYSDFGLALPREVLDTLIAQSALARGAEFRDGTRAEITHSGAAGIEVSAGAEKISARLVIGADGLNSRVARHCGLSRRRSLRRLAMVSHAKNVAGMGDVGEMHVAPFGYVGLATIGHGLTNVAVVVDLDRSGEAPRPADEWFPELLGRFPEVSERMAGAEFVAPVRTVGPFARWTPRATADRVMLVGDAADFHDPFTGEGIYAALHGAELAATHAFRALEGDRFAAADLAAYDADRKRAFSGKWLFERAVAGAVARPALFNRIVSRLSRRTRLGDLMIGAAGDFVPIRELLRPLNLVRLVI